MSTEVQTWHYDLVARHGAENNTAGPEIPYYQRQIDRYRDPHWVQATATVHSILQGNSPAPFLE